ncbi:MAG: dTDP-glucose 4,6-dehydratase [Chloroflexota bacterium]
MRLLVTGGAGFIGSHFVDYILDRYPAYEVVNLDALTYAGNRDNLRHALASPRHEFVLGRIEDGALVDRLAKGVDAIINFAAETHVDRSITGPEAFIRTNVTGTQVLLAAAERHNTKRFFQISTDEVYGPSELDAREKFGEDSRFNPSSPYAASKAAADLLALAYWRTYGLTVVVSRCSNNYGPRQHREKFLPTVILNALGDRPLPIYGDGRYMRDWIHVRDHCRAIDLVLHRGQVGRVYNVAAGNEQPNIEVARRVLAMLGKPESLIQFVADRPGHDRRYAIDAARIQTELGWVPEVSWDQGLRETIEWYSGEVLSL